MKIICILVVTLFLATHLRAQFTSGDLYIQDSISFTTGKFKGPAGSETKAFGIGFSPALIRFKNDTKAIGFRLNVNFYKEKATSGTSVSEVKRWGVGIGAFTHKYYPLTGKFYFYTEQGLSVGYTELESKSYSAGLPTSFTLHEWHGYNGMAYLSPGIGCKLTSRFIANLVASNILMLQYLHQTEKFSTGAVERKGDQFQFSSSLSKNWLGSLGISFGWKLR
jgi:hypothetical protein